MARYHRKSSNLWQSRLFRQREKPKDHAALPDTLDTGYLEERNETGQLYIFLNKQPALYIVLGKYRDAQEDGVLYYVSDYTINPMHHYKVHKFDHLLLAIAQVHKFDHLLLAIAQVHEIIRNFEERKSTNEDVHY